MLNVFFVFFHLIPRTKLINYLPFKVDVIIYSASKCHQQVYGIFTVSTGNAVFTEADEPSYPPIVPASFPPTFYFKPKIKTLKLKFSLPTFKCLSKLSTLVYDDDIFYP